MTTTTTMITTTTITMIDDKEQKQIDRDDEKSFDALTMIHAWMVRLQRNRKITVKSPVLRKNSGFTLVEILVTLGIGMVVLAAVTTTFMSQARFYGSQEQINEMEQNARGALDIITREIKMAGYNPAAVLNLYGVAVCSASQLQIKADLNGVLGVQNNTDEDITYAYDNSTLQITRTRGGETAQVLADNINGVTFTCYKADGATTTTTPIEIRQVKVEITARTARPDPSYNGAYRTWTVTATITPTNLAL